VSILAETIEAAIYKEAGISWIYRLAGTNRDHPGIPDRKRSDDSDGSISGVEEFEVCD
jgi:hypothetical protein